MSHILLRIPLAIVFIQQGLSKFPVDADAGAALRRHEEELRRCCPALLHGH